MPSDTFKSQIPEITQTHETPAGDACNFFVETANPFCGLEPVKYENTPPALQKPVHKCPACLKPWFDDNGKFSACSRCPYRLVPKPMPRKATLPRLTITSARATDINP